MASPRLLLLSNSTMAGTKYMEWVKDLITNFLTPYKVREILFIPFAGVTIEWDDYSKQVQEALVNFKVQPIHKTENYVEAINKAETIMIGGGNTFHLLYKLYEHKLLDVIQNRVLGPSQVPYVGWSAGANVAGPDIGTTNDMPIIWPPSDRALNLVPYNLNPHYNEWKPPNYKGEGRIERLNECAIIKKRPIIAFSEGIAIKVIDNQHQILAPDLPQEYLSREADQRKVKLWLNHLDKTEVVDVQLGQELTQQIETQLRVMSK